MGVELAKQIVGEAQPLALAFEGLRWMRTEDSEELNRLLTPEDELELSQILAERIKEAARDGAVYRMFGGDTPALLWSWQKYGDPTEVTANLQDHVVSPDEALEFLKVFLGTSWGMESGLSSPGDFDRGNYDSVSKYLDPELIMAQLRKRFGSALEDPQFYHSESTPLDEVIAHQFAFTHKAAGSEPTSPSHGDERPAVEDAAPPK